MALLAASAVAVSALVMAGSTISNITLLPLETGAAALDGSPYGFYFIKYSGDIAEHRNRWTISIQGGGWCVGVEDCYSRSQQRTHDGKPGLCPGRARPCRRPVLDATAVLAANCATAARGITHACALRRLAGVVHAVHWAEARLRLHEHQRNGRGFARVSGYANLATTPRICTGGAITCWHARQLLTAQRMVSVLNHGLQVQLHRDDVP